MSQYPLTDSNIDPYIYSGIDLADTLNRQQAAAETTNSGTGRPPYASPGILWIDTSNNTAWKFYMFDGSRDIVLFTIDSTTGDIVSGGTIPAPIDTVNTRIGDVFVREIYNASENAIIATGTDAGLDAQLINNPDPTTNLTASGTGTIGAWAELGGGAYTVTDSLALTAGGEISLGVGGFQAVRVASAGGAVTLSLDPFGTTPPPDGTMIKLIGTSDTNTVKLTYDKTANGAVVNGDIILKQDVSIELQYIAADQIYLEHKRNT
jgi:hypothetical protein